MVEAFRPKEENRATRLKDKLQQIGITTVVFDFDGTLIDIRELFNRAMLEATGLLLNDIKNPFTIEAVKESLMDKIIHGIRREFGINPALMDATINLTAQSLGLNLDDDQVGQAKERVQQIYTTDIPLALDGAMETVDLLNDAGVRVILATHAARRWTQHKLAMTGFSGKFARVACFSIDRPKSKQWPEQIARWSVSPNELLVVGDNFEADVRIPSELGALGVWIKAQKRPFGAELNERDEPKANERLIIIKEVKELKNALLSF